MELDKIDLAQLEASLLFSMMFFAMMHSGADYFMWVL